MLAYVLCFAISTALLYLSTRIKKTSYRRVIILLALLLPCVLAGMRALSIGTDVHVYLQPMTQGAKNASSFSEFLHTHIHGMRSASAYEIGFTFLVYALIKLFGNIHVVMLVIEILIIFPIYFGLKKIKYLNGKVWLGMLIYYLLFYHTGLNAMRQYIAISFMFYGVCSVLASEKKCLLKYAIASIIAFLFHKSSILSIPLILLNYALKDNGKKHYIKYKNFKMSISAIVAVTTLIIGFYLLFNLDILSDTLRAIDGAERYAMYTDKDFSIADYSLIRVFPIVLLFIPLLKQFIKKYDNSLFYIITFCFAYLILGQLANVSSNGSRIANTYTVFNIITYPLLLMTPTTKDSKTIARIIIVAYVILYWWYMFVFRGFNQTIPYVLGI